MRKLASVRKVTETMEIPGADSIMLCRLDGWQCVIKKDDHIQVGDKVIYFEVDSILPEKPEFEFLRSTNFRIKTRKFMKQLSQGLVLPLSYLGKGNWNEGDDVTELLGVTKFEEYEPEIFNKEEKKYNFIQKIWNRFFGTKKQKMGWPEFVEKTDETRVQNLSTNYDSWREKYNFIATEKIEGQSSTYAVKRVKNWFGKVSYKFWVCSRNLPQKENNNSTWSRIAITHNMKEKLINFANSLNAETVYWQGEIVGENIQGNIYKFPELNWYGYNCVVDGNFLNPLQSETVFKNYGLNSVPVLDAEFSLPETIDEIISYADGNTVIGNVKTLREGIVLRSYDGDISFKAVSNEYLLKHKK